MFTTSLVVLILISGTTGRTLENEQAIEVLKGEQGTPVEIPCDLIVEPHIVIVWKQGRRILFAGSLRVRQDTRLSIEGVNLVVESVQPGDAGDYSCQAELDTGELVVSKKSLVVLQPAKAKIIPGGEVITVKTGTSVLLSCSGSGVPAPEISWVREGKVLASGQGEADLPLKSTTWQNGGLYQCHASNGVGEVDIQNFTVHVLHAPVVEVLPAEIEMDPSCSIQIQCLVYSSPRSSVKWFHQGRLLQAGVDVTMWNLEYLHAIQLHDCTDRSGDYTCVAENSLGVNEAVTTIAEHMLRIEEEVVLRVDRQISLISGESRLTSHSSILLVSSLILLLNYIRM